MSTHKAELRQRRMDLALRAQAQRQTIADSAAQLQSRLQWAEIGFFAARFLRARPVLTVTGASLLWRTTRNRPLSWASGLIAVWGLLTIVRRR
ncbi:hypothetical protein [Acidiferrobacter sp.]|uniref:YqjK family protein n=1 Tax=Acidiferrobacter sp. TaxID=1872107 RepID=UPI00263A0C04|nr:hypothetical protein [Acidiferrobacter sp.]